MMTRLDNSAIILQITEIATSNGNSSRLVQTPPPSFPLQKKEQKQKQQW